jgi:ubiquinone/menaquinone biosynthesis C-methylase UbiE
MSDFIEGNYHAHERVYDAFSRNGDKADHAAAWLERGTINHWRFERIYQMADPLLETCPNASWLTVGDGRYGLDAQYLLAHGANVLATDISDTLLREAREKGLIPEFRKENAESMSFADESFDSVLCKESYHHFPRPMKALYEMLRVARSAVLLIEPNDQLCVQGVAATVSRMTKNAVKRLLHRSTHYHQFETGGNYVYSISPREMEKVALGMGLRTVAFRGINDYYLPGVEFEPAIAGNALFRRVSRKIARYDLLCRLGISQPGLLAVVLFKRTPSPEIRAAMLQHGYDVRDLPENPYLDAMQGPGA